MQLVPIHRGSSFRRCHVRAIRKRYKLIRLVTMIGLLGFCALPARAAPDDTAASSPRPSGLMWNRTGLPAVFPLQVTTPGGRDYVLTLIDETTGTAALAAYIEGGAFFKVLVPPGAYRLRFAAQHVGESTGAQAATDPSTEVFELDMPLTFEIRNPGIKAGHLVQLTATADGGITAQTAARLICQTTRPVYLRLPRGNDVALDLERPENQREVFSWQGQLRFPSPPRIDGSDDLVLPGDRYLRAAPVVQTRWCR